MPGRGTVRGLIALFTFVLTPWLALAHEPRVTPLPPAPAAVIGGAFELVSHTGATVTDRDFRGRYLLVFFGFTECPDVCPLTLQNVALALEELGEESEMARALFITVDPERDTPGVMADYLTHFHPNMVGLTGSPMQIEAAAAAFHVHSQRPGKQNSAVPAADDLIEHSAYIYLLGPDGKYRHAFHHAASPAAIAEKLRHLLAADG
jgi:cytochrome oxidase Cu insertion factor (SCO1/SenC/PrrC family)